MDLNHAAACGVLANIQLEGNFNTFAVGDGGTSYGICQWHNGRFSALMAHCGAKGLDYNTLEGQLSYLKQELSTGYLSVLNVLRNFCTNLMEKGIDIKSLQYLMGHSEASTTLDVYSHINYEHVFKQMKKVMNSGEDVMSTTP